MEGGKVSVPEPLAAIVANKGLGALGNVSGAVILFIVVGFRGRGSAGLQLLQGLVLVLLKPVEGSLHCSLLISYPRHRVGIWEELTATRLLDGEFGAGALEAYVDQNLEIGLAHFGDCWFGW